jgi:hypothetical protein
MDTPSLSTLRPKQIAPNPQANPKVSALITAPDGAAAKIRPGFGIAGYTMIAGIIMQAIKINVNQIFSHFQRRSSRIGAEKRPLQIPEKTASRRPVVIMASRKNR